MWQRKRLTELFILWVICPQYWKVQKYNGSSNTFLLSFSPWPKFGFSYDSWVLDTSFNSKESSSFIPNEFPLGNLPIFSVFIKWVITNSFTQCVESINWALTEKQFSLSLKKTEFYSNRMNVFIMWDNAWKCLTQYPVPNNDSKI